MLKLVDVSYGGENGFNQVSLFESTSQFPNANESVLLLNINSTLYLINPVPVIPCNQAVTITTYTVRLLSRLVKGL